MTPRQEQNERMRALEIMKRLIQSVIALGYDRSSAVEVTETLIEDAEKDGIDTKRFWEALERIAPIPKDV
jgi:DNA-binding transcriptional regulator YhcF (GntR family)